MKRASRPRGTASPSGLPPAGQAEDALAQSLPPAQLAELHRDLSVRLGLVRQELDWLKRRARLVPPPARDEYLELAEALEGNVERLESRVERYRASPRQSWDSFRKGTELDRQDIEETLARITRSFRDRYRFS